MTTEFSTENDMYCQMIDTVACTIKVKVPNSFFSILDDLYIRCDIAAKEMLIHRDQTSSKYYNTIPCAISKSLITKYQCNKKCKKITNLVIPICGDKGRQIKLEGNGIRIPAITKKSTIPVVWARPVIGYVRNAEFFKRGSDWFVSICYNAAAQPAVIPTGMLGVDCNSVGHVATIADKETGKVLHLGFNPAATKSVYRGRKKNLQKNKRNRLLCKIRRKQSRRTKDQNHKVSKQIVNYATTHRRAIVLEDLDGIDNGKCDRYVKKSQWSFSQLRNYIQYKAALSGVKVILVDPAYTSKECSRCHQINEPKGKLFSCGYCRHNDHRDANAAFNIAQRGMLIDGVVQESESLYSGLLVAPFPGSNVCAIRI